MSFQRKQVLALESRRAKEMAELIRMQDGQPFVAPAMREVPLEDNPAAYDFADGLYAGRFDMVIFMTGVGARHLHRVLEARRESQDRFIEALRRVTVVARGPKPMAVLREWRVPVAASAAEPNTWREVLQAVAPLPAKRVAVQEYGRANDELIKALEAQGRSVTSVPVYQWALPEDTQPLKDAITKLLAGQFQAALFTTGVQIDHLTAFAQEQFGAGAAVIAALQNIFLASIGPTCTEALQSHGLKPALEPSHPKMGLLVREAAEAFARQ